MTEDVHDGIFPLQPFGQQIVAIGQEGQNSCHENGIAPAWVKEIGIAALVVGVFWTILGYLQMADFIQGHGDIASNSIWGGVKVGCIPVLYGLIVYFVSLVIRVIQKPRI